MGSRCELRSNWDHLLEKWPAAACEGKFVSTAKEHDSEYGMETEGKYCLCMLSLPPPTRRWPESRHSPSYHSVENRWWRSARAVNLITAIC